MTDLFSTRSRGASPQQRARKAAAAHDKADAALAAESVVNGGQVDLALAEPPAPPAAMNRQDYIALVELLFFAYRGFTAEPDVILDRLSFGRAHHRVMHFVTRSPGLRVADLLEILRITKQSLARVLRQLVAEGYIEQEAGTQDRRERLLRPTAKGRALAEQLAQIQIERLAQAVRAAGPGAESVARDFLLSLVADADRPRAAASAALLRGASSRKAD
jgi:DNA-binding MarR family transcriptional regulator